jgi:threonine aldolase
MRTAMAEAEVGDDVYGEDPTVNRLQEMAADRLGKEAALFVCSGTMGNLIAMLTHCGRGDEAIVGDRSHTFLFEQGGMSSLGGVVIHTVRNEMDGTMVLDEIEDAIRADNVHFPRSRLVSLENTHNMCNGTPLTAEYTARVADLAHRHGLALHLDGARVFHAAAALDVDVKELAAPADSVMFCLSKGLSAPVGSVLCGSEAFIAEAHRVRKVLGGGMRQVGVLGAAGIVALEEVAPRVGEDIRRAKELAAGLAEIDGVDVAPVASNIIYFWLTHDERTTEEVAVLLAREGIKVLPRPDGRFRAVTHLWISDDDVARTIEAVRAIV